MRALIIDNHELYRKALADLLRSSIPEISSVLSASSAAEVMLIAAASKRISMILLNPEALSLDKTAALEIVQKLFDRGAIILIEDSPQAAVEPANREGVTAIIGRTDGTEDVVALVTRALPRPEARTPEGSSRPGFQGSGDNNADDALFAGEGRTRKITRRQRQVMGMVSEGLPNKEIAARLGIAEGTVKAHVHTLFRALGTTNRTQAALAYIGMMASAPTHSGPGLELVN